MGDKTALNNVIAHKNKNGVLKFTAASSPI